LDGGALKVSEWDAYRTTLIAASDAAFRSFFLVHPPTTVVAVGFVFELWNNSPSFDPCAETRENRDVVIDQYRKDWPRLAIDDIVWNSGEYAYPAGLGGADLGPEWDAISTRLHALASQDAESTEVYEGLIRISCDTLESLARRGIFGDWRTLEFNVSEVGDDVSLAKERSRLIHERLRATT
jgi:hypothetical protein